MSDTDPPANLSDTAEDLRMDTGSDVNDAESNLTEEEKEKKEMYEAARILVEMSMQDAKEGEKKREEDTSESDSSASPATPSRWSDGADETGGTPVVQHHLPAQSIVTESSATPAPVDPPAATSPSTPQAQTNTEFRVEDALAELPPAEPWSSRMIIMTKSEAETLRSHNSILRSHNLSLARQNTRLRREHAEDVLLRHGINEVGPVNHDGCVRKTDYERLKTENDRFRRDVVNLREERLILRQCGSEWARREVLWERDRANLLRQVGQLQAREQELIGYLNQLGIFVQGQDEAAALQQQADWD